MGSITLLGIDLAKNVYHVHCVDSSGNKQMSKKLTRKTLFEFVSNLKSCTIAMEACAGAHFLARKFKSYGHDVKLIAPQYVKPFVKGNKNDAADAEAICEAANRPSMRFVSIKNTDQQDTQSVHRIRERLQKNRTALMNEIRGLLYEYGVVINKGRSPLEKAIKGLLNGSVDQYDLTQGAIKMLQSLYSELLDTELRVSQCELDLKVIAQQPICKRLSKIGGLGLISITALSVALADPQQYKNGRNFAAWLGLIPKHEGTGGRNKIMGISKRGNRYIRSLLVHGARSKLRAIQIKVSRQIALDALETWAFHLYSKRGWNKTCVAMANKNARIAWAVTANKIDYDANKAACKIIAAA